MTAALLISVTAGAAQEPVTLRAEARFVKAPRGATLGTLLPGAEVRPGRTAAAMVEVGFEGWVPSASLGTFNRDGFNAVIRARAGEQLRLTPDGSVIARINTGVGFTRVDSRGTWTRVRRSAWMERKALPAPGAETAPPGGPERAATSRRWCHCSLKWRSPSRTIRLASGQSVAVGR